MNLTVKRTVNFFSESRTRMDTGENEWDQGNNSELAVNCVRREFLDLLVLHLPAIDHRIDMSQRLSESPDALSVRQNRFST